MRPISLSYLADLFAEPEPLYRCTGNHTVVYLAVQVQMVVSLHAQHNIPFCQC